jgi:hypothetical protein
MQRVRRAARRPSGVNAIALACTGGGNDEEETSFDIESAVVTSAANAQVPDTRRER